MTPLETILHNLDALSESELTDLFRIIDAKLVELSQKNKRTWFTNPPAHQRRHFNFTIASEASEPVEEPRTYKVVYRKE